MINLYAIKIAYKLADKIITNALGYAYHLKVN